MPFYIFKISPSEELEYIDSEEKYRAARDKVRALRSTAPADDDHSYRMIFASTVAQGEKLLSSSAQDDKIIGDD
ncbi:MAG: decarboxylase [Pseudomonadota bacterium]